MDWFRVYTEARKDPKLAILTDSQHRVWFNLLCLAGEQKERENRGTVPAMPRYLLAVEVARADEDLLNETLAILARLRIIAPVNDQGVITFTNRRMFPREKDDARLTASVWSKMRKSVFERDNFTCGYCGARGVRLECDHVIPVSRGGSNDPENLITACFPCNRSKGYKTPQEWMAQ